MERYFFKKEERLCNKRLLQQLYQRGSSFLLYPYRVVFLPYTRLSVPVQVVLSVPKRNIKHAVDRNRIKRRMREIYRLEKTRHLYPFMQEKPDTLLLAIHYIGKQEESFPRMQSRMGKLIKKLEADYDALYLGENH